MEILNWLSSRKGDKTEESNMLVAEQCIKQPALLEKIATGFKDADQKLQSDCAEVFTMVAEHHPDLIVPFADIILPLLNSKETKARWEAVHTLSFIADKVPAIIASALPYLQKLVEKDKSTIVRDHALNTIANYAKTGNGDTERAFEIMKTALDLWEEKHAKQVFKGFANIIAVQPSFKADVRKLTEPYLNATKKVIIDEAKKVMKIVAE